MRQEFPRKVRAAAFLRCNGFCEGEGCGVRLHPGRFQYHHIVEANDGGEATLANCLVVCTACHAPLTKAYTQALRKSERVRDKNTGAFLKSSRPLPGSRASGLKIKMNGTVVRREQTSHSSTLNLLQRAVKSQPPELPTYALEKDE